jgi:hypothetical protein
MMPPRPRRRDRVWLAFALCALLTLGCDGESVASPPETGCYQGSSVSDAIARPTRLRIVFRKGVRLGELVHSLRVGLRWQDNSDNEQCYVVRMVVGKTRHGPWHAAKTVVLPAGTTSYRLPGDFLLPLWIHATVYAANGRGRSAAARALYYNPLYD